MSSSPVPSRPRGAVEDREVEDDEEVVVVDVDLRPLVAREHVLEVEGVEVEVLLQPGALERAGVLDVDPAQAGGVDLLDVRGLRLSGGGGRRRDRRAGQAVAALASEGSASLGLIFSSCSGVIVGDLG